MLLIGEYGWLNSGGDRFQILGPCYLIQSVVNLQVPEHQLQVVDAEGTFRHV